MSKKSLLSKKRNAPKHLNDNVIVAQFKIKEKNETIRIINSFDNSMQTKRPFDWEGLVNNEKEIKDCQIYIEGKKVDYNHLFIFPDKGIYTIEYKFNKLLKYTNCMFFNCTELISLDLSNFNTQNVINIWDLCFIIVKNYNL